MRDSLNRSIRYMRVSLTDRCNLRCRYCMPASGVCLANKADICSLEELYNIIYAGSELGINKIRLTGGEPLVRKGIVSFVARIHQVPTITEIGITTNGTYLAELARPLLDAGLTRINVSLDTLRADRYQTITRGGDIRQVFRALDVVLSLGYKRTKINTVLIGGSNDDEILDLVDFIADKPIDLRFIELMPIGQSALWPRSCFITADEILHTIQTTYELKLVGLDGVSETYELTGHLGRVGLIRPMSHCFCATCNRIRVTADGKLKPCLHSAREINLRGLSHEELCHTIAEGITIKPPRHYMDQAHSSKSLRPMNRIGG